VSQFDLADGFFVREFVGDGALTGKPVVTDDAVIAASATELFVWQLWDGIQVDSVLYGGSLAVGEGVLVLTATDTTRVFTW
jgi:hypothetical protein